MTGHQYEYLYALYLKCKGYPQVTVTSASGDKGVDVIAYKGYKKFAFQCKLHSRPVGYKALEEVLAGAKYYDCDNAIVVTNNTFTKEALEAKEKLKVILQPERTIESLVKVCADGYKEGKFNSENNLLSHLPVEIQEAITSEDRNAIKNIDASIDSAKAGMVHNENEIAGIPEKSPSVSMQKCNGMNLSVNDQEAIIRGNKGTYSRIVTAGINDTHRMNSIVNNIQPSNIPQNSNVIIKQTVSEPQKNHTAIPPYIVK